MSERAWQLRPGSQFWAGEKIGYDGVLTGGEYQTWHVEISRDEPANASRCYSATFIVAHSLENPAKRLAMSIPDSFNICIVKEVFDDDHRR